MDLKRINERISVSGQIAPEDVAAIKAAGFVAIVNNRPDGESPDQPEGERIAEAAREAGLDYVAIPMGREGPNPEMIAQTRKVLDEAKGPVLCYCRSGTRSTTLWALAQAGRMEADGIVGAAADAGYDLSHLADRLDRPVE